MQLYQFERIYSQMEKEFGKIKKGEEDFYSAFLFPLEGNALKIHRASPASSSRRLREAIALVLFDIKEKYLGESIDTGKFRNEDNEKLEKALLMAFDPYTNEKVMKILRKHKIFVQDQSILKEYYRIPIMCLLRLKDSIDIWEKRAGSDGYFEFIENYMGNQIKGAKMDFFVIDPEL